jgi:hypothetical protein
MNKLPISRDIIGIIRKYLTISKINVNKNYKLVIFHIYRISDLKRTFYKTTLKDEITKTLIDVIKTTDHEIFFYCKFCDKISSCYINYKYALDIAFQEIGRNTKYCSVDRTCNDCYQTCRIKCRILDQLRKLIL